MPIINRTIQADTCVGLPAITYVGGMSA